MIKRRYSIQTWFYFRYDNPCLILEWRKNSTSNFLISWKAIFICHHTPFYVTKINFNFEEARTYRNITSTNIAFILWIIKFVFSLYLYKKYHYIFHIRWNRKLGIWKLITTRKSILSIPCPSLFKILIIIIKNFFFEIVTWHLFSISYNGSKMVLGVV